MSMSASKLFGGKRAIVNRMTAVLRDRLAKLPDSEAAILEEAFLLRKDTIKALRTQKKPDMALFDKLSVPLRIPLQEAFGAPMWGSEKVKEKWEEHKRGNWISARRRASATAAMLDVPVEIYVTLKAASEMRAPK